MERTKDFEQSKEELMDVIGTLARAIAVLGKEMNGVPFEKATVGRVVVPFTVAAQVSSGHSADASNSPRSKPMTEAQTEE